jgi:hypothetical protein
MHALMLRVAAPAASCQLAVNLLKSIDVRISCGGKGRARLMGDAFIFDAVRTPRGRGRPDGAWHDITALSLAVHVLEAIADRHALDTTRTAGATFYGTSARSQS